MASQELYRRYRSQTFTELVGQEHIVQTLRNALHDGRIAHAYLFTGPRGVGKTSVARLLAKAVNCTAEGERPCGECESCVAVAEGRHVDVIEMDAASHTSVEDAREIIERVQFRPSLGQYKIYIIDEVHMLSTAAFNALLKTLEEPPGHAVFILATTENHKVPATILSRCQRFVFNRHTIASTSAHLHEIAQIEGFTLEPGVAEALSRAATGSMRDALSVMDQLMSYGSTTISLGQVQNLLGSAQSREVIALIEALLAGDLPAALHAVAEVASQGADLRQFARDLVGHLRDLLLLKAGGDASLIDAGEDELAELQRHTASANLGALMQWVKLFGGIDQQIRSSMIAQLPLEMAVVEALARPAPAVAPIPAPPIARVTAPSVRPPVQTPVAKPVATPAPQRVAEVRAPQPIVVEESHTAAQPVEDSKQAANGNQPAAIENWDAPAPDAEPEHAEVPAEAVVAEEGIPAVDVSQANAAAAALEVIEAVWSDIIRDVRVHDKMVYALLNSGVKPTDIEGDTVVLEVASDFFLNKLNQLATREVIERILKKHTGVDYRIRSAVREQLRENANALREQIRTSRKDPLVKAALNIFDAEIVAVESDA